MEKSTRRSKFAFCSLFLIKYIFKKTPLALATQTTVPSQWFYSGVAELPTQMDETLRTLPP